MTILTFSSAAAAANAARAYDETFPFAADGSLVTVTGGSGAKGSWVQIGEVGAADAAGFRLIPGIASNSSSRHSIDISFAAAPVGGTTPDIADIYAQPTTGGGYSEMRWPRKLATGTKIWARHRPSSAGVTLRMGAIPFTAGGGSPGFDFCDAITAGDATNQRAGTVDINLASTTTWQDFVTLTQSYGAFLIVVSDNGTTPAASNSIRIRLAKSAAGVGGTEVPIASFEVQNAISGALLPKGFGPLIEAAAAAGEHLHIAAVAATPGAGPDKVRAQIFGFR